MILRSRTKPKRRKNRRRTTSKGARQQHLLEVNVRARKATQHRNRQMFTLLCKVILLGSIIGGVYYGGYRVLNELFYTNPDYTLERLSVLTDGTLTREQALTTAEVEKGLNILSIDIKQVRARLEALPQVHSASVERRLPDTLTIDIEERKPIAWITKSAATEDPFTSADSYLVDARGILLRTHKLLPEYMHLPVISGVATEEYVAGQAVKLYELRVALDLLRFGEAADYAESFGIRAIDLSKRYCMLVTDSQHARIVFALEGLEDQLERLNRINRYASQHDMEVASVNLMVKRNIPVELLPASAGDFATTTESVVAADEPRVMRALPVVD